MRACDLDSVCGRRQASSKQTRREPPLLVPWASIERSERRMGLFSGVARRPGAESQPPEDCLECTMIGSGAMFSLAGYMLWQSRSLEKKAELSQIRFLRVLSVAFVGAGVLRVIAYVNPPWFQRLRGDNQPLFQK